MSKGNFTMIISAATGNERDCAIHIKDSDGKDRQMLWCQFSDEPELDQLFIDELMSKIARLIASNKVAGVTEKKQKASTREIVNDALDRIMKG